MNIPPNFPPTWASGWGEDEFGCFATLELAPGRLVNTAQGMEWKDPVEMRFRWILPGTFLMGSPQEEQYRERDETQHLVMLTQGFWLADTACTQAQWQAVMASNPSHFKGDNLPVQEVSWDDSQAFCSKLSACLGQTGFRLPTEAEWEYACRAGTKTAYFFGATIAPGQVNCDNNLPTIMGAVGRETPVAVRSLPANSWGLYEMHGNVWEWCHDGQRDYTDQPMIDPVGPEIIGRNRVLRGGGWFNHARLCRSAVRGASIPGNHCYDLGFRLAAVQTK